MSRESDDIKRGEVIQLKSIVGGRNREPQLSDAELTAIRTMLADFEKIADGCPLAARLLSRRE